ncbi:hypothetical protein BDV24DRAFT_150490 [Aspergillus arachidicola]|uniref:Acyl-CoA dehydrogenase/oxidase C-terminal domain-containing protein n=1 Tax=Aspergillus arachidicola TaxID=656916 RepID=A0A5N6YF74_9EURO|nr:hypothetical protein BDV24DRAFT_150490 [Aspergillus arachidicola]
MSSPTLKLLKADLFKSSPEDLTFDERIDLSYQRAYAVAKAYSELMLIEVGHGLDSRNLETTAMLTPNGDFDIHTPNSNAAKFTPPPPPPSPSWSRKGFPRVTLVFARLLVSGDDGGVKPFIVWLNDAFTTVLIPLTKRAVVVAGKYSLRRQITRQNSKPVPIISLYTQRLPISNGIPVIQQAISFTFKAVLCQASQSMFHALSERCGAQGLWEYIQIIGSQLERGMISIAEGDISALSIKIGTEFLLNRYQPPASMNPTCLLAQHEKGLFDESRSILKGLKGGHRNAEFNSLILPRCSALVEVIGHRRAYEATAKAGVDSDLLALYEIHAVLLDPSWYIQHTDLTREYLFQEAYTLLDVTGASWDAFVDSSKE